MSFGMNEVFLTGNLTRDPELKSLPSGSTICKMRLAVNDSYKDSGSGEWLDRVFYFDVDAWGRMGENAAKYLSKGSSVAFQGSLYWREWEAKDGTKRSAVSVNARKVIFMGAKGGGGDGGNDGSGGQYDSSGQGSMGSGGGQTFRAPAADDDDIPFHHRDFAPMWEQA